jgi:lipopolysaccharide/colanic/teichoic acid biosynthesis glycosyltransferase
LIVGGGTVGTLTAERLLNDPELGLRPVAFLDDEPLDPDSAPGGLPTLRHGEDFEGLARHLSIDHVIIAFSRASHEQLLSLARECWQLGITVSVVPRLFEIQGQRMFTEHLGGLPLMEMRAANPRGWQFRLKYAVDRIVAALALVFLSPLFLAITVAVLARTGRPVLYRQRRVGRDGHAFDMLKFRTMREAATGEADADWAEQQLGHEIALEHTPAEDRLTPVGRFLRRTSLDELPQLWNVLRGDMSLGQVGPDRLGAGARASRQNQSQRSNRVGQPLH